MTSSSATDTSPRPQWAAFMGRVHELKDLEGVLGLLEWEDETYAPSGARQARGPQVATLEAIRHRKLIDPELTGLLHAADPQSDDERVQVARVRRKIEQATKLPEALVKALAEARSTALPAWQTARAQSNFPAFAPHLERIIELTREKAAALDAPSGLAYDALLDEYEPEMTTEVIQPVFAALRQGLVPIVETLGAAPAPDDGFMRQRFDDDKQWRFTLRLLRDLGFDFDHGRQDRSAHPFTAAVNERDVRVTTRIEEQNLMSSISSTVHECGHALYEQGFTPAHHRTYLAAAPSMGIHESQSRLWENQVGLSRPFWSHYLPLLQAEFPEQLTDVSLDAFWRAINRVTPSLIRVDADEVTYNLHIVLRFELELALIGGDLSVRDLPTAWSDKMHTLLGVRPPDDARGCLQDIHWASGAFGYFPTYTLGNLYAAQLFAAFQNAHPTADQAFATGRFETLLAWLRDRVHHRGHTAAAQTIVSDAVGEPLSVAPFLDYLRSKYSAVYDVSL